jgi:hypothetical protein
MDVDRTDLANRFSQLSDAELLERFASGALTALARDIAAKEILRRGLELPEVPNPQAPGAEEYGGDYEAVARFFNVMDAHVVCSLLEAAGIPAYIADAQIVQTNSLWAPALGGARIMVQARYVAEAKEAIAAFNRGALALQDEDKSA